MSKGSGRSPRKPKSETPTDLVRQEPLLPAQTDSVSVTERQSPVFSEVVRVVREAAGALVDFADKVADAIKQRIEGRA